MGELCGCCLHYARSSDREYVNPQKGIEVIVGIVGIKINYHLLTSIYVTSILSYTVLEDDANDEK